MVNLTHPVSGFGIVLLRQFIDYLSGTFVKT